MFLQKFRPPSNLLWRNSTEFHKICRFSPQNQCRKWNKIRYHLGLLIMTDLSSVPIDFWDGTQGGETCTLGNLIVILECGGCVRWCNKDGRERESRRKESTEQTRASWRITGTFPLICRGFCAKGVCFLFSWLSPSPYGRFQKHFCAHSDSNKYGFYFTFFLKYYLLFFSIFHFNFTL